MMESQIGKGIQKSSNTPLQFDSARNYLLANYVSCLGKWNEDFKVNKAIKVTWPQVTQNEVGVRKQQSV